MTATSSFSLTGTATFATSRKSTPWALSQAIGEIEAKASELRIPSGGAYVSVPLGLSATVTEALLLVLYSPKKLIIEYTSSDADDPGPMKLGLKGLHVLTLSPGEGITTLRASNPSTTEDVTLEYGVCAKAADADDDPDYWDDE